MALPFALDGEGRARVYVGKKHPYGSRSGQQRRARLIAMVCLGRRLQTSEHVHHVDGDVLNDWPENLEVVGAEYHGWSHCMLYTLARSATGKGRIRELRTPQPWGSFGGYRLGPIISRRPVDLPHGWKKRTWTTRKA